MSEIRWYRVLRLLCLAVALETVYGNLVEHGPATVAMTVETLVVALVCVVGPAVCHSLAIGTSESFLDHSCDPEALVRRGDRMRLADRIPRRGLSHVEVVLLHRYGIALADVGRADDAAKVRRRIEQALAIRRGRLPRRNASSRRWSKGVAYCAVAAMCLSDLCSRLGDADAAAAYADQFREGVGSLPASAPTRGDEDLDLVGRVTTSSSATLFLPTGAAPEYDEGDVATLESSNRRRRLAAEARMALAAEAFRRGEADRERSLLEQVAAAAPKMRVGRVAADRLGAAEGTGEPAGYETLRPSGAVDPHPALPTDPWDGTREDG